MSYPCRYCSSVLKSAKTRNHHEKQSCKGLTSPHMDKVIDLVDPMDYYQPMPSNDAPMTPIQTEEVFNVIHHPKESSIMTIVDELIKSASSFNKAGEVDSFKSFLSTRLYDLKLNEAKVVSIQRLLRDNVDHRHVKWNNDKKELDTMYSKYNFSVCQKAAMVNLLLSDTTEETRQVNLAFAEYYTVCIKMMTSAGKCDDNATYITMEALTHIKFDKSGNLLTTRMIANTYRFYILCGSVAFLGVCTTLFYVGVTTWFLLLLSIAIFAIFLYNYVYEVVFIK